MIETKQKSCISCSNRSVLWQFHEKQKQNGLNITDESTQFEKRQTTGLIESKFGFSFMITLEITCIRSENDSLYDDLHYENVFQCRVPKKLID